MSVTNNPFMSVSIYVFDALKLPVSLRVHKCMKSMFTHIGVSSRCIHFLCSTIFCEAYTLYSHLVEKFLPSVIIYIS
jgi:hypothetical protein